MLPDCWFQVAEKFEYSVGSLDSGDVICVHVGFKTDMASVPRFLWFILPPHGQYGKAAVVHDYLYQECHRSRKDCDLVFKEGMEVLGVKRWKISMMYYAVRLCGRSHYGVI